MGPLANVVEHEPAALRVEVLEQGLTNTRQRRRNVPLPWPQANRCGIAKVRAPELSSGFERDVGFRRRAMFSPIAFVARLDSLVVVGEGRVPLTNLQLVGDAGEFRHKVGIVGGAFERHESLKPKRVLRLLDLPFDLRLEVGERNRVAGLHLERRLLPLGEHDLIVGKLEANRIQLCLSVDVDAGNHGVGNLVPVGGDGVGQIDERWRHVAFRVQARSAGGFDRRRLQDQSSARHADVGFALRGDIDFEFPVVQS